MSLAEIASEVGVAVPCAGNLPLDLDDPHAVWFIAAGAADLFVVEHREGVGQSAPRHLLRATAGRLLPGIALPGADATLRLTAKGLPGAVLKRLPAAELDRVRDGELAEQVDAWLADVSATLSRYAVHRPTPDALVEPGEPPETVAGCISARRGVAWVSAPTSGVALFLGLTDLAEGMSDRDATPHPMPLTAATWLTLSEAVPLSVRSSETLAKEGLLLEALTGFHRVAFAVDRLNRRLEVVDEANLARARATNRRVAEEGARRRLFNLYGLLDDRGREESDASLRDALRAIGRHEGIEFKWPQRAEVLDADALVGAVLDASGVRARRVRLASEDRWWIGDSGAMLGFRADDGRPVALLPGSLGHYLAVEPGARRKTRITAERAADLRPDAWTFYPVLPPTSAGPRDLWRLARKGLTADLARLVVAGLLGGLVMLLPAVMLGFVVGELIPTGESGLLVLVAAALAASALIGALLHVLQGMVLMRLEGRAASRMEAAFWERLLRLTPASLHRYPAGDLAMRGMTFQSLRDGVQGVVADAVLAVVFLSPALLLILSYDLVLGGVAMTIGLLSLTVTVALGLGQLSPFGRVVRAVRESAGRLFQLIGGIARLRVDGAEGSGFAVWARGYREQKEAELDVNALDEHLEGFSAAMPFLAAAVLLLAASRQPISVGNFLVVYAAFMVFQTAVARVGKSCSGVAALMPAFNQVRPLLAETPEASVTGESVERLRGEVRFDHVSFRYDPDGPLILDDVSIHANPGEFVAITGGSGAGKSTLFHLALGLVQPLAGALYYDGRDLAQLNVKQLRRQLGVVPQQVELMPDDLWDNVVGAREEATEDEVWEAARMAAVDREIKAMPMRMATAVGAGGSVLSGGESQRVVIAQALIRNPAVLLLDEATNWLDNNSQAQVMRNLAQLTSTRIVIAHRLSTLRQADRIYVMRSGKVVQEGSFAELEATEGDFRNLVRRQLT